MSILSAFFQESTILISCISLSTSSDTNSTATESAVSETAQATETATATDSAAEVTGTGVLAADPCVVCELTNIRKTRLTNIWDSLWLQLQSPAALQLQPLTLLQFPSALPQQQQQHPHRVLLSATLAPAQSPRLNSV